MKNDLIIPGSVIWPLARQVRREAEQEWNFMRTSKTWAGLIQSAFDGPNLLDLVSFAFATGKHGYLCHGCVLSLITQIADLVDRNVLHMGAAVTANPATKYHYRSQHLLRVHQRELLCQVAMDMWHRQHNQDPAASVACS